MSNPLEILNRLKNLHKSLLDLDTTLKSYEDKYMILTDKIITKEQILEKKRFIGLNKNELISKYGEVPFKNAQNVIYGVSNFGMNEKMIDTIMNDKNCNDMQKETFKVLRDIFKYEFRSIKLKQLELAE